MQAKLFQKVNVCGPTLKKFLTTKDTYPQLLANFRS